MSGTASAGVPERNPATVRAARRRDRRLAKLYWCLWRPRPGEYARAVAGITICRVTAAVMASLAITLYVFLGIVLGNMSYPRWSTTKNIGDGWAISVAAVPAVVQLSRWVPAIVLFSVILISIPRANIWIFRLTILGGVALGFYQWYLPPFPQPAAIGDIVRRVTSAGGWAQSHLALLTSRMQVAQQQGSWVVPVYIGISLAIVLFAFILYRSAYLLTARTGSSFPRRPRSHNGSGSYPTSLSRRLMAVLVTVALLSADLWILQNIHSSLPEARYGAFFEDNHIAAIDWALAALGAALIIGAALITWVLRPRGYRWIWIAFLVAMTVYAVSTHVYLLHLPAWIPPAPQGFWMIVIIYFIVTVFCFDLVAALLDWPIYIPAFARRTNEPML
jgi:hypothetical protein